MTPRTLGVGRNLEAAKRQLMSSTPQQQPQPCTTDSSYYQCCRQSSTEHPAAPESESSGSLSVQGSNLTPQLHVRRLHSSVSTTTSTPPTLLHLSVAAENDRLLVPEYFNSPSLSIPHRRLLRPTSPPSQPRTIHHRHVIHVPPYRSPPSVSNIICS
jgi:hypothetical protein